MAKKEIKKENYDTREITSLLLKSQWLAGCFRFAHSSSPRAGIISGYFPPPLLPVIRSWSASPRGEGYICRKIVRITWGSELPGSRSARERSNEEALGYRMRGTTNWRGIGIQNEGHHKLKRHRVTEWGAPQTEEAMGYRMRDTTNLRDIGLQNEGHHKLKRQWVTEWGTPQTEETLGYRMRDTTNWRGIGLQNEEHHKLKRQWVTEWGTPQT
jgi:hypothetical protein